MTTPPPIPHTRARSLFVTLLAWIMMLIGVLGLPISVITVAMILVKSYGTQTFDPLGFVIIVLGPSMMLVTGFGLLKRWRWARGAAIALLALVIISNAWDLIKGPRPTTTTFDSSGVPTTTMGSGTDFTALPIIGVCAAMMLKLLSPRTGAEFQPLPSASAPGIDPKSWRAAHRRRDVM